jgi:membrane fusion protein (multidrug efflux system)
MLLLAACDDASKSDDNTATTSRKPVHVVEITRVGYQTVQSQLAASGTIEAGTKVRLYNEISGKITYLPNHEGDAVSQHTIVIGLDDTIIEAELAKATATREQAKIDYDRLEKLKQQLASADEVARAETAYDIALADEKLQQIKLDKTTIKAPFDGVITERHYEPGDVVPMHSHILTMIDPESLHVTIQLSEKWIPLIQLGDKVEVQVDALAGSVHPGEISRIYPTINPNTRKGTIEVEFLPAPYGASAGQLARVQLKTHPAKKLVIPAHALHHDASGAYVYTVDENNKSHKVYVKKGAQFGNLIEVISGLGENDQLVVKGFNGLRNGKQVKIHTQLTEDNAKAS